MDVWGPARVRGQGHERYFLLVIDDYSRYTTVFPLRSKGEVPEVLIDWIRSARCQLCESFGSDLPVLRLHSDRGGEFSSDLQRAFCRAESIRQSFMLLASPQQNGIAERRIGMVMDVTRISMIHAAAPHFLWPFAVQYAAHQINLQPRVSLPESTPTLRWTGKVGDASAFRVWGSLAFVRDTTADKLSSRADVTFDESVSYYRLFPYRTASLPPPPHILAPGTPPVDPLPLQGPAPSGVSQVDPAEPVEVAVDSGATRGAEPAGAGTGCAGTGGAEPERVEPGGAESGGAESGRAEPGGAEHGRVEPEGTVSGGAEPARAECGGALGVPSRREPLSPQHLRSAGIGAAAAGAAVGAAGAAGGAAGAGAIGGATGAGASGAARAAGGTEPARAESGGALGVPSQQEPLSPLQLHEWYSRRCGGAAGAGVAGASGGVAGAGAAGGGACAGGAAGAGAAAGAAGAVGAGGADGAGAAGGAAGAGAAGAAGGAAGAGATRGAAGIGDPGAGGSGSVSAVSGGAAQLRPYYVPLLQQVLGSPPSHGPPPPFLSPPPV
ncbi:unnamed protein product [Closterium sp. NIES-54]